MQKNASPRYCVAAYWRKPPIKLPRCLSPVGWIPEKIFIASILSFRGARKGSLCRGVVPGESGAL